MREVRARTKRLAYLGTVERVQVALTNEYGRGHPMPPRSYIQNAIDERRKPVTLGGLLRA